MRTTRTRGLVAALAGGAAALAVAATPAHASHLTGGTIAAGIDGQGKATGQLLWYERGSCSVGGSGDSAGIQITDPDGTVKSFDVALIAFRCTASAAYYRATFAYDLKDATTGFGPTLTPGRYAVTYSNCCRVGGILNAGGGNVSLTATPRYVPGSKTSSPELLSPVPLGFGIGHGYDADFRPFDPDGAGAVTMALLQGAQALEPFYDADAPGTQRVMLGTDGHVRMTPADTATYAANQRIAYKVRATDADGDSTAHDVLLSATTNTPPVLASGQDTLTVAPGETLTVPVVATDADSGDVVDLAVDGQPEWATFTSRSGNPATGELTLAPPAGASGTTSFTVDAIDSNPSLSLQATRRYTVTVAAPQVAPPAATPPSPVAEAPTPAPEPEWVVVPDPAPQPAAPRFSFVGLERFASGTPGSAKAFFDAAGPGRFIAQAYATVLVPTGRAPRAAAVKRLSLFTRTRRVDRAGRISLDLSLTRPSLKKLARHGLMKVVVKARFIPVTGDPEEVSHSFDLKRFTMLFVRDAKLTRDRKGLRIIVRVPAAGRLRAVARATHDGREVALGSSAVRSVARGERDVHVRLTHADVAHLLGAGTSKVRVTTVLDRKGKGRQTRTRSFGLAELTR